MARCRLFPLSLGPLRFESQRSLQYFQSFLLGNRFRWWWHLGYLVPGEPFRLVVVSWLPAIVHSKHPSFDLVFIQELMREKHIPECTSVPADPLFIDHFFLHNFSFWHFLRDEGKTTPIGLVNLLMMVFVYFMGVQLITSETEFLFQI